MPLISSCIFILGANKTMTTVKCTAQPLSTERVCPTMKVPRTVEFPNNHHMLCFIGTQHQYLHMFVTTLQQLEPLQALSSTYESDWLLIRRWRHVAVYRYYESLDSSTSVIHRHNSREPSLMVDSNWSSNTPSYIVEHVCTSMHYMFLPRMKQRCITM